MNFDIQELRGIVTNSRLGRVWRWGRSPWALAAVLRAPDALPLTAATQQLFPDIAPDVAEACRLQLLNNSRFYEELNQKLVEKRHRRADCEGWNELLYMLVRFAKPKIVLETGVFDGISSAVIL